MELSFLVGPHLPAPAQAGDAAQGILLMAGKEASPRVKHGATGIWISQFVMLNSFQHLSLKLHRTVEMSDGP